MTIQTLKGARLKSLRTCGLDQGFSNFWSYGAHEEIEPHNKFRKITPLVISIGN